ncbi:cyclin-U4-1 [Cinnamomum micranthum f. kanehirae]|uniref:Cyclin-U4-1 n=1 Tax=Cinnamomum micranthum f. kanehirae TaxID=337451 RepID=A0A3S3N9Z4_9MAGN|nr:cyclin-U4-1 [Cinnamomum micranthum f. kanehirae]
MVDFGNFQLDPNDKFIKLFSSLLHRVAESNYWVMPVGNGRFSVFDCITRPSISIQSYLEMIVRLADCSPSCYVVSYIYLDRFIKNQPWCPITFYNVHFLVLTSVMVSAKFMDDIHYNNCYYAQIGGVSSTKYMNFLRRTSYLTSTLS